MNTSRLEAFSDGVIAIIITIMVLELHVPTGGEIRALWPLWPTFVSYGLSFAYVGIYWNNHHHLFQTVSRVSGGILWANLNLLFWLSLLPFSSAWMGQNHRAAAPALLYGLVLLAAAISYTVLEHSIICIQGQESLLRSLLGAGRKEHLSIVLYLLGIGLCYVSPPLAQGCYVMVALLWLVPDRRIERALGTGLGKNGLGKGES
jgi:uncharacterized membrane protein